MRISDWSSDVCSSDLKAFGDVAKLRGARFRTMFEDAFTCLEHQVQAAKLGVLVLQLVDHAQRLRVVLEAAVGLHALVERVLAGVPERRVAEIVRERHGFAETLMSTPAARGGSGGQIGRA